MSYIINDVDCQRFSISNIINLSPPFTSFSIQFPNLVSKHIYLRKIQFFIVQKPGDKLPYNKHLFKRVEITSNKEVLYDGVLTDDMIVSSNFNSFTHIKGNDYKRVCSCYVELQRWTNYNLPNPITFTFYTDYSLFIEMLSIYTGEEMFNLKLCLNDYALCERNVNRLKTIIITIGTIAGILLILLLIIIIRYIYNNQKKSITRKP